MLSYCLLTLALLSLIVPYISCVETISFPLVHQFPLQLDQHISIQIPQFFPSQSINLTVQSNSSLPCQIILQEQAKLTSNDMYYHYGMVDPEMYYFGDKKVFQFEQLKKLHGMVDAINMGHQVIVAFRKGSFTVYDLNASTGKISNLHTKQFPYNNLTANTSQINYGNLVINQQKQVIFFSQDNVFLFNNDTKTFEILSGYQPIGYSFQKAIIHNNTIYVAGAQKGILIYEVDFKNKVINKTMQFKPMLLKDGSTLQVQDLYYQSIQKRFTIIDQSQGIYWVPLPQIGSAYSICDPIMLPLQKCTNLQYIPTLNSLLVTCPLLIIISLQNKTHKTAAQVDFVPISVFVNNNRIILFGESKYGVYDIIRRKFQMGKAWKIVEKAVSMVGDYLVTVNRYGISTGQFMSRRYSLYCKVSQQDHKKQVGSHPFQVRISGDCQQILTPPKFINPQSHSPFLPSPSQSSLILPFIQSPSQCVLIFHLNLTITDASIIDYFIQIVLIGIVLWMVGGGVVYLCVKDVKVKREYQQLQEEQSTNYDKSNSDMVLSAVSQNKGNS